MPTAPTKANPLKLDSGAHYQIKNNSNKRIELIWARIDYSIQPGESKIVPFAVVCLYFGDPRSRTGIIQKYKDSTGSGQIPERWGEIARLSVRYGVYEQGMANIADHVPDVTITTLDNKEIIPPCFDPEGIFTYGFEEDTQRADDVVTIIANLQAQLDAQKERLDAMGGEDNLGDDVETDDPEDLIGPR